MAYTQRFPLRSVAVAATFINLGIHLTLAPDHLAEKPYIGVLFVIGAGLLGLVVVGLATERDRLRALAWLLGSAASAVMFAAFLASRTTGLPLGYHEAWIGQPEDLLGLACLALELVFLSCAAASLTGTRHPAEAQPPAVPTPVPGGTTAGQ
jgi:hypothetical protein